MSEYDLDEWMKMTDEQQEAILAREMAAYNRWWDSLTPGQQYASSRHRTLKNCMAWRKHLKTMNIDCFREHLRDAQIRLLKIRAWRATGVYPGNA